MTEVTNSSNGPRGIRNIDGDVVMLEPGQSAEIDLAAGEESGEWFTFAAEPVAEKKTRRLAEAAANPQE